MGRRTIGGLSIGEEQQAVEEGLAGKKPRLPKKPVHILAKDPRAEKVLVGKPTTFFYTLSDKVLQAKQQASKLSYLQLGGFEKAFIEAFLLADADNSRELLPAFQTFSKRFSWEKALV